MDVTDVLSQVDILEYISQYCDFTELNGEYWALSPLKDENTPSFSINTEKQVFFDFSSGCGGNLITFIQLYNDCDFITAIKILMKYANISDAEIHQQGQRLECAKIARRFRQRPPPKQGKSIQPLPDDYMDRYVFDLNKLKPWIDEGITIESLRKFGVKYDKLSNRIVFPIRDYNGRIINVSGRTLDDDFKQNKIPKYIYYKSLGTLNTIYGLSENMDAISKSKSIILFEGAKSVMKADGWGIYNTGAILTSHLSENQFLYLARMGYRTIFALDKDVNILDDKYIQRLKHYVRVEYIRDYKHLLSAKMSPVDNGEKVFRQLLDYRMEVK